MPSVPSQARPVRVRFAPSPTGMLHVGNARTALYNWLYARHSGGAFILRIEDTDVERSEQRHESQLMEDLLWMGLGWSEGPVVGGPHEPYRQSERLAVYAEHTQRLLASGRAYRCFCTVEQLEQDRERALATHQPQNYIGRCRSIAAEDSDARAANGEPFAIRLKIPAHPLRFEDIVRGPVEFPSETISDPVLVRTGGMPVYNYVVTIDDALMEITHVIRGDDHISNTPRQVAIYEAFGWTPPAFAHLSTILGEDRERLSKRHGATSVASFREMGILPEALVNYLALLGWGPEGGARETFTAEELVTAFKLERVTPSPAVFDWDKLYWLNRHYLKMAEPARLRELAWPHFAAAGLLPARSHELPHPDPEIAAWFESLLALFVPSVDRLEQLPAKAAAVFGFDPAAAGRDPENAPLLASEAAGRVLAAFAARVTSLAGPLSAEQFKLWMNEIKQETGIKGKELFHPIRIALTGAHSGPEFDKLIPLIERGASLPLARAIPSIRARIAAFQRLQVSEALP